MEKLAINGGAPVKTSPYGKGMRFGKEELAYLEETIKAFEKVCVYFRANK